MKILLVTDYFPPERTACAFRAFPHALMWQELGHQVTVLTSVPNFPLGKPFLGYRNRFCIEVVKGIQVVRVRTFMAENKGFCRRILDYSSFTLSAIFSARRLSKPDVVIGSSPPLFAAMAAWRLARRFRVPFVFEVRDLWPESVEAVGVAKGLLLKPFQILANRMYKDATLIASVTDSYVDVFTRLGIAKSKIGVFRNGFDRNAIEKLHSDVSEIKAEFSLPHGKKLIGYVGTTGLAHNIKILLQFARRLGKESSDWHVVVMGGGANFSDLVNYKSEYGLNNVSLLEQSDQDAAIRLQSVLDIGFVHLKKTELFKSVVPSKIYELMALGVPLLLGVDGEARKIVERGSAGVFFEPDDLESMVDAFEFLQGLSDEAISNIKCSSRMYAQQFERQSIARAMLTFMESAL